MSKYYVSKSRTRREKIGFYTAFSICVIAVCMAVYSTYNTVTQPPVKPVSVAATGVQAIEPSTVISATVPAVAQAESTVKETEPPETEAPKTEAPKTEAPVQPSSVQTEKARADALQTMLSAEVSLNMPTQSGHVLREFSRDSVYFKTLNTWKPHTGVDFDGNLGDSVSAMLGGEVTKIYDDRLYGKTVELSVNNVTVGYSGMGGISVNQGDKLEKGDKLGTIGAVPCEAGDRPHIHVYVRVNGTFADPLSFIGNND